MNPKHGSTVFKFTVYLLLVACAPIPVPNAQTSNLSVTDVPSQTLANTDEPIPTDTSTPVPTDTSTPTPLPPPLLEIFPQGNVGKEFFFANEGGVLNSQLVRDQDCVHSGVYGVRITYSMQGPANGGWGVHWSDSQAGHFVATGFRSFTFWVKGAVGSETFQVAMKDTDTHQHWIDSRNITVVSTTWTQVTIPLSDFLEVNKSSLENFSFGFNQNHNSGSICIDEIAYVN